MKPLLSRVLIPLGALAALVALVILVVDAAVRGTRTGLTTTAALTAAGLAVVLVGAGVLTAGRSARRPDLRVVGVAAAVVGVVAAAVLVLAVPQPTLLRGVTYDAADGGDLTLSPPAGVAEGDLLVATVYRRGLGALRTPPGWTAVRADAVPGTDGGTLTLLTRPATDDDRAAATFAGDGPGSTVGGITAFSHASGATVAGEQSALGATLGPVTLPAGRASAPSLAVVALSGSADVTSRGDADVAWRAQVGGPGQATVALLTRPGGSEGTATVDAVPAPAAWAVLGVELTAG